MIKCTCIYKFRDEKGNIKGYKLRDNTGKELDIESNELKKRIASKQFEVDNLTLTSDNRLLSKTVRNIDAEEIKKEREKSKIGKKYQTLFEPLGIEVVTAAYLAYPREGDDIKSMFNRTFKDRTINDIKQLVVDPTDIVGYFSTERECQGLGDYIVKNSSNLTDEKLLTAGDIYNQVILLVLKKNCDYRTVIFSEIEELSSLGEVAQEMCKLPEYKYNISVITLDHNKEVIVTNVGKRISNSERKLLSERILDSTIDLWVGQDVTRKILEKVDKKQAAIKLKRIGVSTLAVPFAAVALVGAVGVTLAGKSLLERVSMPLEEKIVYSRTGPLGLAAYRKLKEKDT